jgi:hypothetical protein
VLISVNPRNLQFPFFFLKWKSRAVRTGVAAFCERRQEILSYQRGTAMNRALMLELPTEEQLGDLAEHIQRKLNGRVRDFRVSIRDDGLVLEGHTHTYHAKQLAQHAVMEAVDVPIRSNEIIVI